MENRRTYVTVDIGAVRENFRQMENNLKPQAKIIAVVKANAYGHGAAVLAGEIEENPRVWGFATATVEEAVELRESGITKPISILGYTFPENCGQLAHYDLRPAVWKLDHAREISQAAVEQGKKVFIHLAVDTGMSRIGFSDGRESLKEIQEIGKLPGLEIEGIFTHFARADEASLEPAREQLERYLSFLKLLEEAQIHVPLRHCSNSAGILRLPEANLDAVRAGITMYGIYPSDDVEREPVRLQPVMEWKSHISYIKEVGAGVEVSYGGTYVTEKPTRIATIPVGYADGYPRSLSNKGYVLVWGQKAPILGRVCMDQFMVDVTHIPQAADGDEVTLMGRDYGSVLTVDELGALSGRFPYEFVCCISSRVPRLYLGASGKKAQSEYTGRIWKY